MFEQALRLRSILGRRCRTNAAYRLSFHTLPHHPARSAARLSRSLLPRTPIPQANTPGSVLNDCRTLAYDLTRAHPATNTATFAVIPYSPLPKPPCALYLHCTAEHCN